MISRGLFQAKQFCDLYAVNEAMIFGGIFDMEIEFSVIAVPQF